jgi:DNA-binding GntR family transcriptional regulator
VAVQTASRLASVLSINPGSPDPPFRQIAADLRRAIRAGEFAPGDQLPSTPELARRYNVARQTAQRALDVLRVEGLIVTRAGTGAFVSRTRTQYRRSSRSRYGRARADQQLLTSALRHEVIFVGRAQAPPDVADIFELEEGAAEMLVRRRVLYDREGPVEVGASWLRLDEFGGTVLEAPTVVPKALFLIAEEISGRRYAVAVDRFSARAATAEEAALLRVRPDTTVLQLIHTAMDADRTPIEVSTSVWPAARVVVVDEYEIPQEAEMPADPSEV